MKSIPISESRPVGAWKTLWRALNWFRWIIRGQASHHRSLAQQDGEPRLPSLCYDVE
jgi:hypothetical protein